MPTFVNTAPAESCAGISITSTALDREQDADIAALQLINRYNPETYSHNCRPIGIKYYPGNGIEKYTKYYRTEFRSIQGAGVTYRYVLRIKSIKIYYFNFKETFLHHFSIINNSLLILSEHMFHRLICVEHDKILKSKVILQIFSLDLYIYFLIILLASQQIKQTSTTMLLTPSQFDLFDDDTVSMNDVSINSSRFLGSPSSNRSRAPTPGRDFFEVELVGEVDSLESRVADRLEKIVGEEDNIAVDERRVEDNNMNFEIMVDRMVLERTIEIQNSKYF